MARVQVYEAKRGLLRRKQWRARVVSKGRTTFVTPEGYNNRGDLMEVIANTFPDCTPEILD